MLDKTKVDRELARRFCAAVMRYQLGVSIATQYKKTPEDVGDLNKTAGGCPRQFWMRKAQPDSLSSRQRIYGFSTASATASV